MKNTGKVTQIISAVVDVEFENGEMPAIYNALECQNDGKKLILEVARLRCSLIKQLKLKF